MGKRINMDRVCSIPDCGKIHLARGFCSAHWERWKHHGDPLGGGTPVGEPMRFYRQVVLTYTGTDCLTWPYSKSGEGYGQIEIDGRTTYVHRLACQDANGHPPSPAHQAAHSCGKGHLACVNRRHLSWKTQSDNEQDKVAHGTSNRGERHGNAKLTDAQVLAIRALKGRLLTREIAQEFGTSARNIAKILSGQRRRTEHEAKQDLLDNTEDE